MRCQLVDRVEGGEEGHRGQGAGDQVDGADANTNQQVDADNKEEKLSEETVEEKDGGGLVEEDALLLECGDEEEEEGEALLDGQEKQDACKGTTVYLRMEEVPKHVVITPRITNRHPSSRSGPQDPDIQIAEQTVSSSFASLGAKRNSSGVLALCGPNPAKISLICLILTSVWISWVFVIHLNKEMSDLDAALQESMKEIDRLHLAAAAFRKDSESSITRLEEQLTNISSRRRGARKPVRRPSPPKQAASLTNKVSSNPSTPAASASSTTPPPVTLTSAPSSSSSSRNLLEDDPFFDF